MTDMIPRAAARDIIVDMRGLCRNDVLCDAVKKINAISSVDAVPVVRCKDCRHWHEDIDANTKWLMCHEIVTEHNWFCADGERRDDDADN